MLRHSVMRRIQNMPGDAYFVSGIAKRDNEFTKELFVPPDRQSFYIFENERARSKLRDNSDEFKHQTVSRIFQSPVTDQRKALTRRPAEYAVHRTPANPGCLPDICRTQADHRTGYDGAVRKIEFMRGAMDGVDFNRRANIEPGLLESQAESASPREEVDRCRAHMVSKQVA